MLRARRGASMKKAKVIWMNGEFVPWDRAQIHVLTHGLHYGSSVFEGIRCYSTEKGPAVFRLKDHTERLFNSAKIYRMEIPYTQDEIDDAILATIRENELKECYIRPIAYRGYGEMGVNPFDCPVDVAIAVWEWGKYLGPEAVEQGVDVMVSTWQRMAPNTFPAMAKTGANYMNSQLIKMEALLLGFVEGIALDVEGYVSEGSGENLFMLWKGELYTPPLGASILPGITRDSVIRLALDKGTKVRQHRIPREWLYMAEEVFFTGSAAEITPIRSIDKIPIGSGTRGPVTAKLQEDYFGVTSGQREDRYGWLTHV
jgi:branched-chain amino acid aminotransferase